MNAPHTTKASSNITTIGIAGLGAIGSAVGRALIEGIDGLQWTHASDMADEQTFDVTYVPMEQLADHCDIVIECLPPHAVPPLAKSVIKAQKTLIMISGCALLMYPEIIDIHKQSTVSGKGRIVVPSGALAGIDGVKALKQLGIKSSKIASTKHPRGFTGAPYVDKMGINVAQIKSKTKIFEGNALEAAKGFPANVNVAATLSLAGIGAEETRVEIWADPDAKGNCHEITVEGTYSKITSKIESMPDPANPKSSMLAAQSIVCLLKDLNSGIVVI